MRDYYVYIMSSLSKTLYVGITNDLQCRVYQHKNRQVPGFTSRYKIDRLVHFETTPDVSAAIAREKQIKGWLRAKKVALVESANPEWDDLSESWYGAEDRKSSPDEHRHRSPNEDPSLRSG